VVYGERERERESKKPAILFLGENQLYPLNKLTLFISGLFMRFVPAFFAVYSMAGSLHNKPMSFPSLPDNGSVSSWDIEELARLRPVN
jgi:hypothetical protein